MAGNKRACGPRRALGLLLAASAWAGGVHADETVLQLYGVVDAAVSSTHVSGGGESAGTRGGVLSGGQTDSLWGLRLTEPLGNGWQVNAGLESGFDAGNGQSDNPGQLFNYGSWVGLASDSLGELRLGRQSTIGMDYGSAWRSPPGARWAWGPCSRHPTTIAATTCSMSTRRNGAAGRPAWAMPSMRPGLTAPRRGDEAMPGAPASSTRPSPGWPC